MPLRQPRLDHNRDRGGTEHITSEASLRTDRTVSFVSRSVVKDAAWRSLVALALAGASRRVYRMLASGSLTLDVGRGRRIRPLGPVSWDIPAERELVFDVIAAPYLERTPRALEQKLQVWERGSDMVLAAHFTPFNRQVTTTVETVRFNRPERIDFRVVRGPVPHVVEAFVLEPIDGGTRLTWQGELGTDLWAVGAWWGAAVARAWETAVRTSVERIAAEARRRAER